jgi:uncharacterized protein YjbI with pentapeptide repeats
LRRLKIALVYLFWLITSAAVGYLFRIPVGEYAWVQVVFYVLIIFMVIPIVFTPFVPWPKRRIIKYNLKHRLSKHFNLKTYPWYKQGLILLEMDLQNFEHLLSNQPLLKVLANLGNTAGKFAIFISAIIFVSEYDNRQQDRINQAWQLVNTSGHHSYHSGRIKALEFLYNKGESLDGLDANHFALDKLNFQQVSLSSSVFDKARLRSVNLSDADLAGASFKGALLSATNLEDSMLMDANLQGAKLIVTNLRRADLESAKFDQFTQLLSSDIKGAIFHDVKGLTVSQVKSTRNWQYALFDKPMRDELGIKITKGWKKSFCQGLINHPDSQTSIMMQVQLMGLKDDIDTEKNLSLTDCLCWIETKAGPFQNDTK